MGCGSHRKKQTQEFADQKWDYINLADFKAKGCGAGFAYGYLWFQLLLSIAVYAVDSFTAINLLVFNRWSSQIEPAVSFDTSRWIFAVCIVLSFVNLIYEGIRAIRIMRRGNVAECFLDSLAVRWESIRMGSGQGWKRFLVFAELTKSKKGAEYIALFTYFSFKSWIRVLVCSGPRQVINAITLVGVYDSKFTIDSKTVEGSIADFFLKIGELYEKDYQQALILSGMCFTLVVWAFSALFLIAAVCFYVFFLFHWLPRSDGGLAGYCERKVNKALLRIVTEKVNKALAKGQAKAAKRAGEKPDLERAATLPTLPNVGIVKEDSLPEMPMLGPSETTATLPEYTSRPASPGHIELSNMDRKRPVPSRSGTGVSGSSYASNAPLIAGAAEMGHDRSNSPVPSVPDINPNMLPPQRLGTANSQRNLGPRPGIGHMNTGSNSSLRTPIAESHMAGGRDSPARTPQPPTRQYGAYNPDGRSSPAPSRQYEAYAPGGRSTPDPAYNGYRGGPPPPGPTNRPPYQPGRSATGPMPPRGPNYAPQRNMTAPMPPRAPGGYSDRPLTPQGMRGPPQNLGRPGTPQSQRGPPSGAPYGHDARSQFDRSY